MRRAGLSNCSALGGTLGGAEVGLGGMRLQIFAVCRLAVRKSIIFNGPDEDHEILSYFLRYKML